MPGDDSNNEEKSFFCVIIVFIAVIILCVCTGFFILGYGGSKNTLYALISVLIIILLTIIVFIEWFRKKSVRQLENNDAHESPTPPPLRINEKRNKKTWENKRFSERSSWMPWFPMKFSGNIHPTAPYETEV